MITKQKCLFYQVGDQFFKTLVEAQKHDLKLVIDDGMGLDDAPAEITYTPEALSNAIAALLINFAGPITDILTTTPTSRAKARKTNGGKRAKKAKLQPAEIPAD